MPFITLRFVKGRRHITCAGSPRERNSFILGIGDIHPPGRQDIEPEAGTGPCLNQAHAFSSPILKSHDSNAPELVDISDPLKQIGACEFLAEQLCHIPPPDRFEGLSRRNYFLGAHLFTSELSSPSQNGAQLSLVVGEEIRPT